MDDAPATNTDDLHAAEPLSLDRLMADADAVSSRSWTEFVRDLSLRHFGKEELHVADPPVTPG